MRICFIAHGNFGFISPYLDYFKAGGHDVHFVALSPTEVRGVPTYNMGFGRTYTTRKGKWKYLISMPRVRRLVKMLRPDIVHTHYATSGGLTGLVCGFHPTVVTAHGTDLSLGHKSPVWRPLLKAVFNHADCVNTVSEDLKEKAVALGVSPDKIHVLTPGVDTKNIEFVDRPIISSPRPLRLVTTRRLEPLYDHATAISALSVIKSKGVDFRMTFVSGGSLLETLRKQVEKEGLSPSVSFLGGVGRDEVPEILRNNDVFLSTPLWDGISVALLEAMASGLFPIVSNLGVNAEWLEDGRDGYLYEVGNVQALSECILRLLEQPEIVVDAGKRNRKRVEERGDRDANMKRLGEIYEALVARARENSG